MLPLGGYWADYLCYYEDLGLSCLFPTAPGQKAFQFNSHLPCSDHGRSEIRLAVTCRFEEALLEGLKVDLWEFGVVK